MLASTKGVESNGWRLDFSARQLTSPEGKEVQLTTLEYQVLSELVSRPNRILSRDQIVNFVLNRDLYPEERNIDIVISKIRRILDDNFRSPKFIMTVRNQGYTFIAKVEKAEGKN